MNIIEIVGADAMAEKTTIGLMERIKRRQQKQVNQENDFCKLIEKINQKINDCATQGFKCCSFVVMELDYWGVKNFEEDMNTVVKAFTTAGYDIGWYGYGLNWTHRTGKLGYFQIEW